MVLSASWRTTCCRACSLPRSFASVSSCLPGQLVPRYTGWHQPVSELLQAFSGVQTNRNSWSWARYLRHILRCAIRTPLHPQHLPSIRRQYLLCEQSVKELVRVCGGPVLETHVPRHWYRWRCQSARWLHGLVHHWHVGSVSVRQGYARKE